VYEYYYYKPLQGKFLLQKTSLLWPPQFRARSDTMLQMVLLHFLTKSVK